MNKEKKVVIDIRKLCIDKNVKIGAVCEDSGTSSVSLSNWKKEAPEVVKGIFYALQQNKTIDILKILKDWQKLPHVLSFILYLMVKYDCKFTDIVVEN